MVLADKIVGLSDGRIEQVGGPLELYRDPDNNFVAGFIGFLAMNFLNSTVEGAKIHLPELSNALVAALPSDGTQVVPGVRPQHLTMDETGDSHQIDITESMGGVSYVYLNADNGERFVVEARADAPLPRAGKIGLRYRAKNTYVFDATPEMRIR